MPLAADSIQLGPWTGGVRYDIPVEECAQNELSDMLNARVGTGGQVEQRKGTDEYGDYAALAGAPTTTGVIQFESAPGTSHVVLVAGDKIYKDSSGWSDITGTVTVTAGDDNTWEIVDANGTIVGVNGVDTNAWKWSGSGNASDLDDDSRFSVGKHIEWFDNRLWIGNVNGATNQLWYSDTADIETWGATSFFNFGGVITGLKATQNALTVHTTDGIYTLIPTGNATNPYHPQRRTQNASVSGRSIVSLPDDTQLMVRDDGIYEWSGGAELRKVSLALDGGYWPDLNTSRLKHSFAVRFPRENEIWFFLPKGSAQTEMNEIMVYNYRRRTVINRENVGLLYGPYDGRNLNCAALIDNKPHAGDYDGNLWDYDDASNDDNGTSITSYAETGAPAPLGADVKVRWLNARHYYNAQGSYVLNVLQKGAEFTGSDEDIDLDGTGFVLDSPNNLDNDQLREIEQLSQDLPLQDYAPQSSLRYSMNAVGQTWNVRRTMLRYKPLGRYNKPKPVDA